MCFAAIGELLGNIENALIAKVLEKYYDNDESKVPQEEYLARVAVVSSDDLAAKYGIQQSVEEHGDGSKTYLYDLSKALPPQADWLEMLAGPKPSWLRAFLTNVSFVQGSKKVPNQVSKVFAPRHNQRVKMHVNAQGQPLKVEVGPPFCFGDCGLLVNFDPDIMFYSSLAPFGPLRLPKGAQ